MHRQSSFHCLPSCVCPLAIVLLFKWQVTNTFPQVTETYFFIMSVISNWDGILSLLSAIVDNGDNCYWMAAARLQEPSIIVKFIIPRRSAISSDRPTVYFLITLVAVLWMIIIITLLLRFIVLVILLYVSYRNSMVLHLFHFK